MISHEIYFEVYISVFFSFQEAVCGNSGCIIIRRGIYLQYVCKISDMPITLDEKSYGLWRVSECNNVQFYSCIPDVG